MKTLKIFGFILFFTGASADNFLKYGHGALIYDAELIDTLSQPSNHPGSWGETIQNFNLSTTSNTITRLYVYGQSYAPNISPSWYQNSFASQSIPKYREKFPDAEIYINIDGAYDPSWPQDLSTDAHQIATQICRIEAIDGVFFDIEPLKLSNTSQLLNFYKKMRDELQSDTCKDEHHPNGRNMAIFGYISNSNAALAQDLFNNGMVFNAIPLYDYGDIYPNAPPAYCEYKKNIKSILNTAIANANQYNIPFSLVVSASASFSLYENAVPWQQPCQTSSPNISQYITAILSLMHDTEDSCYYEILKLDQASNYLGMDFWAWNHYLTPDKINNLCPNYPTSDTLTILSTMNDTFE